MNVNPILENYFFAIYIGTKEQCKWFIERRKYRLM